jgi:hypothetical protein
MKLGIIANAIRQAADYKKVGRPEKGSTCFGERETHDKPPDVCDWKH